MNRDDVLLSDDAIKNLLSQWTVYLKTRSDEDPTTLLFDEWKWRKAQLHLLALLNEPCPHTVQYGAIYRRCCPTCIEEIEKIIKEE